MQGWDYALGISAIKREQSLFQGTLVAQGAFSVYRSDGIEAVGGWPLGVGEDIMLTWLFLAHDYRVYHEPLAAASPRSRSRCAASPTASALGAGDDRGDQRRPPVPPAATAPEVPRRRRPGRPWLDAAFTFVWLPGLVLALTGRFWIVGPYTILVIPLSFAGRGTDEPREPQVLRRAGMTMRRSRIGFLSYVLTFPGHPVARVPLGIRARVPPTSARRGDPPIQSDSHRGAPTRLDLPPRAREHCRC